MKRLVYPLAILSILLFACNLSTTVTPPVVTAAPVASETPTEAETPTMAETPVSQANVNCHELALFLDPALASGFNCQTVPELSGGGPAVNPGVHRTFLAGLHFCLTGSLLPKSLSSPSRSTPDSRRMSLAHGLRSCSLLSVAGQ